MGHTYINRKEIERKAEREQREVRSEHDRFSGVNSGSDSLSDEDEPFPQTQANERGREGEERTCVPDDREAICAFESNEKSAARAQRNNSTTGTGAMTGT
jgi:hypothetical protein